MDFKYSLLDVDLRRHLDLSIFHSRGVFTGEASVVLINASRLLISSGAGLDLRRRHSDYRIDAVMSTPDRSGYLGKVV
jgi:hypothetical protein